MKNQISNSDESDFDLDLLMDLAISEAQIEQGIDPTRVARSSSLNVALFAGVAVQTATKPPEWTPDEVAYLHENHARMSNEAIGARLGRSKIAVKVRRKREHLREVSTCRTEYLTANQVAIVLGEDVHKVCFWFDQGFMPGFVQPGERRIRLIPRRGLTQWAVNPDNWIHFDPANVNDPHLARLLQLRAERWNDEWWTTRQVADYHGVTPKDILRFIITGHIQARHVHSLGGRNPNQRWAFWFVRKSEATRADLHIWTRANPRPTLTPHASAWIVKARDELGMSWASIGRTMGPTRKRKRTTGPGISGWTVKLWYEKIKGIEHQGKVKNDCKS